MKNVTKPQSKPKLPITFADTFLQKNEIKLGHDYAGFSVTPTGSETNTVVSSTIQKKRSLFGW